jgi:hypothetical protein
MRDRMQKISFLAKKKIKKRVSSEVRGKKVSFIARVAHSAPSEEDNMKKEFLRIARKLRRMDPESFDEILWRISDKRLRSHESWLRFKKKQEEAKG